VIKILESLGVARPDAEVYIYLAKKGPIRGEALADSLKIASKRIYAILRDLERKGMVTSSTEEFTLFSAVAFERVLDLLVKANIQRARTLSETNEELIASWRISLKREDS
jgi:sugar-specific transcriptional regulator TrmB